MEKQKIALITGASKGLGFALAHHLAQKGWTLLINARNARQLLDAQKQLSQLTEVTAISGDIRDEVHLLQWVDLLEEKGWKLDLLVNNASALGISPMPKLLEHPVENLHTVFHTNIIAPLSLLQKVKPYLNTTAAIVNISSDAAVEPYENWGAYGGSKAGMDHLTAILSKENPSYRWYAFDPGDMRTDMHQAAFPGEDISDRPMPEEEAVPALIYLLESDQKSGRYNSSSLLKLAQ